MLMTARRTHFRDGLRNLYLPIYDKLCADLGPEWQPFYGQRTAEQQAALYAVGRTVMGRIVTDALPWESPHNYGCASDWVLWVGGLPVWMMPNDPRWQAYYDACGVAGARAGASFRKHDRPHNELQIDVSWVSVRGVYEASGLDASVLYIERHRVSRVP